MSLFQELEQIEATDAYRNLTPAQRQTVLDSWSAQSTGDPEKDEVRKSVAEEALSQSNARMRARMPVDPVSGQLKQPPLSLANIASSEVWTAVLDDPEAKRTILSNWRSGLDTELEGADLDRKTSERITAEAELARIAAEETEGDLDAAQQKVGDFSRAYTARLQAIAANPGMKQGRGVFKDGKFVEDPDGEFEVNPAMALLPEDQYSAYVDQIPDLKPLERARLKGTYGARQQVAYGRYYQQLSAAKQKDAPEFEAVRGFEGTMLPNQGIKRKKVEVSLGGKAYDFSEVSEIAITPQREVQYGEKGGSQEALFSPDEGVRKEARKRTALQFANAVLPASGDMELADIIRKNPEGPEATALVDRHVDALKSTLWVPASRIKDNLWEKARVMKNGEVVVNPEWARTSPTDIDKVAEQLGVPEKADDIREQVEATHQAYAARIVANADSGVLPWRFQSFVAEQRAKGVTDPVEILAAHDKEYGYTDDIMMGLRAAWRQAADIGTFALGVVSTLAPDSKGLQQLVADRAAASAEEEASYAELSGKNKREIVQGIATELPWLVMALGASVGASAARRAAIAYTARNPARLAAANAALQESIRTASAAPLLASSPVQAVLESGRTAMRTYFGVQAGRSAGGMYTNVYNQLLQQNLDAGMNMDQAQRSATVNAVVPAAAAGLTTAVLMKLMPGGTEAALEKLSASTTIGSIRKTFGEKALSKAFSRDGFARKAFDALSTAIPVKSLTNGMKNFVGSAITGGAKEAIEEAADEAFQASLMSSFDDRMTLQSAMEQVVKAGFLGGIIGGGMSALSTLSTNRKIAQEIRAAKEGKSPLAEKADNLEQEGDTATADALRNAAGGSPLVDLLNSTIGTTFRSETIPGTDEINEDAVLSESLDKAKADALEKEISEKYKNVSVTQEPILDPQGAETGKFRIRVAMEAAPEEEEEAAPTPEEDAGIQRAARMGALKPKLDIIVQVNWWFCTYRR